MTGEATTTQELLHAAAQLQGEERERFVRDACERKPALREELQSLLRALDKADHFLELPAVQFDASAPTLAAVVGERPGEVIGPYKLLQMIGEGGFGAVYMAEQTRPVHRKVALKIIKLGMDTRQVIARFEAERQVLAMMDHPSIAKVFDAGSTASGRPYFVMELVRGSPITSYCDEHRIDIE